METFLVRVIFVVLFAAGAALVRPVAGDVWIAALLGSSLGGFTVLAAARLQRIPAPRLVGLGGGLLVGLACAALVSGVIGHMGNTPTIQFLQVACVLLFGFIGGSAGYAKGDQWNRVSAGSSPEATSSSTHKILDTSVVIDGRIADIADTGFLDGVLVIPQFVLHELQMVADSADSMKRNRGRRGLDVLQRIQKMPHLQVLIVEQDFPAVKEVDMKLIELAKMYGCKIITNDFNLNKVAQLRGVVVLNINELANSLKPIVLPGESMRVFILKEGKEYNQGVAYLDDGTMVVVDNARRMISKTIDVSVTSVLQTTAGKMIFGKYDERAQSSAAAAGVAPAAAAALPLGTERQPRREQTVGEN